MKAMRNLIFIILIVVGITACKKDDDDMPSPNAPDTVVSVDERMAILEECRNKAIELHNLQGAEDRIQFLAWLLAQPYFASAGFAEEDIYAVFQDERVAFFVRKPLNDSTGRIGDGGRTYGYESRNRNPSPSSRPEDVPKSKKVSLFSGLGQHFNDSRLGIEKAFSNVLTQYRLQYLDATIDNLKSVSDDAVFHFDTHGGLGTIYFPRSNRTSTLMGLYTTVPCNAQNEETYSEDIDKMKICYMLATYDTSVPEWHYAITQWFIDSYMKFGENCLIYLDACNTFSNLNGAPEIRDQIIQKATDGKATIVGWTRTVHSNVAERNAHFIYERLLGNVQSESPIQRPFDLDPVFADLHSRGMDIDPSTNAVLTYKSTVEGEIMLAPTIDSLYIDEYTSTLLITGLFGNEKGKVTVDGFDTEVVDWNNYGVTCKLKETGLGSAGNVVVHTPQGHQSNPVPITEWTLVMNYSVNDNGVKFSGVCKLRLRADIHPRRHKPHESPVMPNHPNYSNGTGYFFNAKGSSATYNLTGHKYDRCTISPCTYQATETPIPKSGSLVYDAIPGTDHEFLALYNWGPEMKTLLINVLAVVAPPTSSSFEARTKCDGIPEHVETAPNTYQGVLSIPSNDIPDFLHLQVANNYNILSGTFYKKLDRPWGFCNNSGIFEETIQWDVAIAHFPPTDKTPARAPYEESGGN